MSKGFNLNLNIDGKVQKIQITKDMDLNNVGSAQAKQVLSIFDQDKDGILQEAEFKDAKNWKKGTFSFSNNSRIIDYYETDKKKNVNYAASWHFDKDGNQIASTRDTNGDGMVDRAYVPYDHNHDAELKFNQDKPVAEFVDINKNRIIATRLNNEYPISRLVNTEEGVNYYSTYGMSLGKEKDGKMTVDIDLDGVTDYEETLPTVEETIDKEIHDEMDCKVEDKVLYLDPRRVSKDISVKGVYINFSNEEEKNEYMEKLNTIRGKSGKDAFETLYNELLDEFPEPVVSKAYKMASAKMLDVDYDTFVKRCINNDKDIALKIGIIPSAEDVRTEIENLKK